MSGPSKQGLPHVSPRSVRIHYRRIPDREQLFDQRVVLERDDVIVTLSEPVELEEPMSVAGRILLEHGSLALWFTFPGAWHDIARFHAADGTFTGLYANVLTPVLIDDTVWHTTDLFLDVWWPAGGTATLLDEDELDQALGKGHIDPGMAQKARAEGERLLAAARAGRWPPAVVEEWSLGRALQALEAP